MKVCNYWYTELLYILMVSCLHRMLNTKMKAVTWKTASANSYVLVATVTFGRRPAACRTESGLSKNNQSAGLPPTRSMAGDIACNRVCSFAELKQNTYTIFTKCLWNFTNTIIFCKIQFYSKKNSQLEFMFIFLRNVQGKKIQKCDNDMNTVQLSEW